MGNAPRTPLKSAPIVLNTNNNLHKMIIDNDWAKTDLLIYAMGLPVRIISAQHKYPLSGLDGYLSDRDDTSTIFVLEGSIDSLKIRTDNGQYVAANNETLYLTNVATAWKLILNKTGFALQTLVNNKLIATQTDANLPLQLVNWEDNMRSLWFIAFVDPREYCMRLPKNFGFAIPACDALPKDGSYYNELASEFCSGKSKIGSRFLTNVKCQGWCNQNPALCESATLRYCRANPTAKECACIYANRQADYLEFVAKYPKISGSASCFTKACRGTNYVDALIPASVAATRCPDITDIKQTTTQQLNVEEGATVIGASLNAQQSAEVSVSNQERRTVDAGTLINNVPSEVGNNVPTMGSSTYFILFMIIVFFGIIIAILSGGSETNDGNIINDQSQIIPAEQK